MRDLHSACVSRGRTCPLKYTGYAPDHEISVLPLANLTATPWNIAVNGVMAGCRPEHLPVLIAAVQAMGDPEFRYRNHGGSTHWGRNLVPSTFDAETLMQVLAYGITNTEALGTGFTGQSRRYVLVEPGVARILAEGGYSKQGLRQALVRTSRKPTHEAVFSQVHGSFGRVQGSFKAELARALRGDQSEKGKLPPWLPRNPGWEEIETVPAVRGIEFVVCGDPARNKAQVLAGGPGAAIAEIRLPADWDELMAAAGYRALREFYLD